MEVLESISDILSADDLAKLSLLSSLSLYYFVGDRDEELDYISTAFLSPNITTLNISVATDIAVMMLEACPNLVTACFNLPLEAYRDVKRSPSRDYPRLRTLTIKIFELGLFCAILDAATCPSLDSLSLEVGRQMPMLPMGDTPVIWEGSDSEDHPVVGPPNDDSSDSTHFLPESLRAFLVRSNVSRSLQSFTLENVPLADDYLMDLLMMMPHLREFTIGDPYRDSGKIEAGRLAPVFMTNSHLFAWLSEPTRLTYLRHIRLTVYPDFPDAAFVQMIEARLASGLTRGLVSVFLEFIDDHSKDLDMQRLIKLQRDGLAIRVQVIVDNAGPRQVLGYDLT
ncbi:hypothetical protein PQX77_020549 [Marasmius sp. AFHP31]|nr:hypothetical protein PQX77_020549 [Marasmius sp. AFHP31]